MLFYQQARSSKPDYHVDLNHNSPHIAGFAYGFLAIGDQDISGEMFGTLAGERVLTKYGWAYQFDGVSDNFSVPDHPFLRFPDTEITLILRASLPVDVGSENFPSIINKNYDVVGTYQSYIIGQVGTTDRSIRGGLSVSGYEDEVSAAVTVNADTFYWFVLRWVSGAVIEFDVYNEDLSLFGSGVSTATPTGSILYRDDPLTIAKSQGSSNIKCTVSDLLCFKRRYNDYELLDLLSNPYQLLAAINEPMFANISVVGEPVSAFIPAMSFALRSKNL